MIGIIAFTFNDYSDFCKVNPDSADYRYLSSVEKLRGATFAAIKVLPRGRNRQDYWELVAEIERRNIPMEYIEDFNELND